MLVGFKELIKDNIESFIFSNKLDYGVRFWIPFLKLGVVILIKTAILTLSDKGSMGEREDITGQVLINELKHKEYQVVFYKIVPDEIGEIERELIYLSDDIKVDLIITNGGTGFSKRDVTPEATRNVIEKYVPGFSEIMRMKSFDITAKSILSRGISGIRKKTLIINLPGSPKGAMDNLKFIIDVIPHGIQILRGKASECAEG